MKKLHIILVLLTIVLVSACNSKLDDMDNQNHSVPFTKSGESVTFSGGPGVKVLIFDGENGTFNLVDSITSGWDANNKTKKNLVLGHNYKFIYYKSPNINSLMEPSPLSNLSTFDQIKFSAIPNGSTHVLPVDEIWLPEENFNPAVSHTMTEGITIYQRLTRAVSQIEVHFKRGIWNNGVLIDSIPFPSGQNILQNIQSATLNIDGVGEAVNVSGGIGNKQTSFVFDISSADIIPATGFAVLEGPFVFPKGNGGNSTLNFTVTTNPASGYPEEMTKEIQETLERNRKLKVTLWFGSTYRLIDVTYEMDFISDPINGDDGIWE